MSAEIEGRRLTANDLRVRKGGEPIVALTSYHAHTARLLDGIVDFILVGDSLGMVMHGLETTLPVTLDMMVLQGQAVMRGSKRALVVVDLPFGSYEESPAHAFRSAVRVMKETGCGAVKLEGGRRMAETIAFLVERGIPVMGHVGLTPQSFNTIGGFRVQGRSAEAAEAIRADAAAAAAAGAFAIVLEAMVEPLAREITAAVPDPDHRNRRLAGLRRPDPRPRGHARAKPARAQIRQALWQPCRRKSNPRSVPMRPTSVHGPSRPRSTSIRPRTDRGSPWVCMRKRRIYMVRRASPRDELCEDRCPIFFAKLTRISATNS